MTIRVIAAGLGRNATLSMKFALEALGFGPCHHMTEVFAAERQQVPLWLEAVRGRPQWDAIFDGFASTSDYPSATYWREIAAFYPDAKVVLTTREPESWFDSVSTTILSPWMQQAHDGTPLGALMQATVYDPIGGDVADKEFVTSWYRARNRAVIEGIAPERILQFDVREGWEPLSNFLGVPVPSRPFPHINSRAELGAANGAGTVSRDPQTREVFARLYIEQMRDRAFASRTGAGANHRHNIGNPSGRHHSPPRSPRTG
ncbi:hypothetical protein GCM10011515_15430 [Tsuneonella deserti]|uniref:Sulfotransferase family protein n=1 Tax=Tsuneonella deserti TaxID=2035528 RepID=A0ABQ1SAD0_9SPHN|nr:sulfotransferase family protein [Tsuneonella deserti]GGD96474.1 hypothetical protein GCM10011515_15430 [Tsuneonella deserti]